MRKDDTALLYLGFAIRRGEITDFPKAHHRRALPSEIVSLAGDSDSDEENMDGLYCNPDDSNMDEEEANGFNSYSDEEDIDGFYSNPDDSNMDEEEANQFR
jgi:hypothetical protein